MKYILFLFLYIYYYIKCEDDILEYYINYTLISPTPTKPQIFHFFPHYEVGTINFIIYFSEPKVNCRFRILDGDKEIDNFISFYGSYLDHTLNIPESNPKPSILMLEVTNTRYEIPYYMYIYNKDYMIPLSLSNYYFYQLSMKNLVINYEIPILSQDIYFKVQSTIEFPELSDNIILNFNEGEIEHILKEKTSYYEVKLIKNKQYKLNLKCNLFSEFTNKTMILIYFEENEKAFKNLIYNNDIISYKSIFTNDKIFLIDTVNLIDEYNSYTFNLREISEKTNINNIKVNVYIKKYRTYDIDYIKNNTPSSDKQYDEVLTFEKKDSFMIKSINDFSKKEKTILIYLDINYSYQSNPLYEYSIQKISGKKNLEFKSYLFNWYTKYEFYPLKTDNKDTIFITTNHSNTIFPIISSNTRTFTSLYKGYLFVSYPETNTEVNEVLIK